MAITVGEDSYVSLTEADTYFGAGVRPYSTEWAAETVTEREGYLKHAFRYMNVFFRWTSSFYADDAPDGIKQGQMEIAFSILSLDIATPGQPVPWYKATGFDDYFNYRTWPRNVLISPFTDQLLRPYGRHLGLLIPTKRGF